MGIGQKIWMILSTSILLSWTDDAAMVFIYRLPVNHHSKSKLNRFRWSLDLFWGYTHFYNGCLNTKKLCHALWFPLCNNTKQENCAETQQKTPSMAFKDNALCCSHIQCSKIVALLCIYTVCIWYEEILLQGLRQIDLGYW